MNQRNQMLTFHYWGQHFLICDTIFDFLDFDKLPRKLS